MPEEEKPKKADVDVWKRGEQFIRSWVVNLLDAIDEFVDPQTRAKVYDKCGRGCAQAHTVGLFKKLWNETPSLEEFLPRLEKAMGEGGATFRLEGNLIKASYPRCFCMLSSIKLVNTPSLCDCSLGWLRENLESILVDKEVVVERICSVKADGADSCEFKVRI